MIDFREIWAVDFEFIADPGGRPIPVCLVAKELRTGRLVRQWRSEFAARPPYPTAPGPDLRPECSPRRITVGGGRSMP